MRMRIPTRRERTQNKRKKANETNEKSVLSRTRKRSAKSDPLPQGERVQEGGAVLCLGQAVSNTVNAITITIVVMAAVIRDHVQYAPRSDSFRFLHDLRS